MSEKWSFRSRKKIKSDTKNDLTTWVDDEILSIEGKDFSLKWNLMTGNAVSLIYHDREIFAFPAGLPSQFSCRHFVRQPITIGDLGIGLLMIGKSMAWLILKEQKMDRMGEKS